MDKKQQNRIATRRMARELTADEMKSLKGGGITGPVDPGRPWTRDHVNN
ncbi:hypothetical protein [Kordiimonas sp.]